MRGEGVSTTVSLNIESGVQGGRDKSNNSNTGSLARGGVEGGRGLGFKGPASADRDSMSWYRSRESGSSRERMGSGRGGCKGDEGEGGEE